MLVHPLGELDSPDSKMQWLPARPERNSHRPTYAHRANNVWYGLSPGITPFHVTLFEQCYNIRNDKSSKLGSRGVLGTQAKTTVSSWRSVFIKAWVRSEWIPSEVVY